MRAAVISEGEVIDRTKMRKRGHPTTQVVFRCPDELVKVIDTLARDRTPGVIRLLDQAVDSRDVLGERGWFEVQAYASANGLTEGEALGRLALEALKKTKR